MSWHTYVLIALVGMAALAGAYAGGSSNISYGEYFLVRQVEHILQERSLLVDDPLGAQGRSLLVLPVVPFILAVCASAFGVKGALVVFSALMMGTLVGLSYALALILSRSKGAALFSAVCVACSPAVWGMLHMQMQLAGIALLLCAILGFLSFSRPGSIWLMLASLVILLFTDTMYVVLVAALLLYVFFLKMEDLPHSLGELEMVVFMLFLSAWGSMIVFREALFIHGTAVLFSNVPAALLAQRTLSISALPVIFGIGLVQVFLGFVGLYLFVFRRKNKEVYVPLSILLVVFFAAGFGVLESAVWLGIAAIMLSVLAGMAGRDVMEYAAKTHFSSWRSAGALVCVLVVLVPLVNAPIRADGPTEDDVAALAWARDKTPTDAVIMALPDEGFAVEQVAARQTVVDTRFLLVSDAGRRYDDAKAVFDPATAETEAVSILNEYGAGFVFVSERSVSSLPSFFSNERCFQKLFDRGARVYALRCKVRSFA